VWLGHFGKCVKSVREVYEKFIGGRKLMRCQVGGMGECICAKVRDGVVLGRRYAWYSVFSVQCPVNVVGVFYI
jgi:hypothetical protein